MELPELDAVIYTNEIQSLDKGEKLVDTINVATYWREKGFPKGKFRIRVTFKPKEFKQLMFSSDWKNFEIK